MTPTVAQLRDSAYWAALAPPVAAVVSHPTDTARVATARRQLLAEGYCRYGVALADGHIAALRGRIDAVAAAGLPRVFAFVYDDVWGACAALRPMLVAALGPGFRRLPCFWIYSVGEGDAGWGPHRDRVAETLDADGRPRTLSLWIALTAATPDNGCIYVLRAARNTWQGHVYRGVGPEDLHDVHALPAAPGEALLWNQAVTHWGARPTTAAAEPRVSLSYEFQRGDVEPFERPLLDLDVAPPLDTRLALIGKQIGQYAHMYGAGDAMRALGAELVALDADVAAAVAAAAALDAAALDAP